MTQHVTIANLDQRVVQRLKQLAWQSSLPFEEFVRQVLIEAAYARKAAVRPVVPGPRMSDRARRLFEPSA